MCAAASHPLPPRRRLHVRQRRRGDTRMDTCSLIAQPRRLSLGGAGVPLPSAHNALAAARCGGPTARSAFARSARSHGRPAPHGSLPRCRYYAPSTTACTTVAAKLCALSGFPLLSLDYRMLPEHPIADAVADTVRAIEWLSNPGNRAPGEAAAAASASVPVLIAGDSAGAGLAVLAALAAPAAVRAQIAGMVLFSP